jgi:hypothetical protein
MQLSDAKPFFGSRDWGGAATRTQAWLLTTPSRNERSCQRNVVVVAGEWKSSQALVLPTDSRLVLAAPCHHISHSYVLYHCYNVAERRTHVAIIMYPPNSNNPYYAYAANTTVRSKTTTMPPGVKHPQAGEVLGPDSCRCECGGTTGIGGTSKGANKWRNHMRTSKHMTWDPLFN